MVRFRFKGEIELSGKAYSAEQAQRIFIKAFVWLIANGTQNMRPKVLPAIEWVDNVTVKEITCHRINREIAATQIFHQIVTKTNFRFTRFRIIAFGTKSSNLYNIGLVKEAHCTKALTNKHDSARTCWSHQTFDFIWMGIGCQVRVGRLITM